MNANEIRTAARNLTIEALMDVLNTNHAIQFADASFAILQEVDGQAIWTEVTVKSKAYKPTKNFPAFNPREVAEEWKAEKEVKAMEKADKEAEKARKLAAKKVKEKEAE